MEKCANVCKLRKLEEGKRISIWKSLFLNVLIQYENGSLVKVVLSIGKWDKKTNEQKTIGHKWEGKALDKLHFMTGRTALPLVETFPINGYCPHMESGTHLQLLNGKRHKYVSLVRHKFESGIDVMALTFSD